MYKFNKNIKEKAVQQKQMEKTSRRLIAKQRKANIKSSTRNADSDIVESSQTEEIAKDTA